MGLFSKAPVAPTTVDQVLAGFATLKQQLQDVLAVQNARVNDGYKRIDAAKAYAAEVEKNEIAAIDTANKEIRRADNAAAIISNLLGEPVNG